MSSKPGTYEFPIKEDNFLPMDFKSVWAAMEDCQRLGLTNSIGVSNFSCKKLTDILAIAKIPPAVNQVKLSLFSLLHSPLDILFGLILWSSDSAEVVTIIARWN